MAATFIPLPQPAVGQAGALGLAAILQSYLNAKLFMFPGSYFRGCTHGAHTELGAQHERLETGRVYLGLP